MPWVGKHRQRTLDVAGGEIHQRQAARIGGWYGHDGFVPMFAPSGPFEPEVARRNGTTVWVSQASMASTDQGPESTANVMCKACQMTM